MNSRTYRALLIANSTFPSDPHNLPNLEGPRNDAGLLRDALCDREYGLFASDNVRLVQERPMSELLREIEDFLRSASRQDTLLLYYSGHGVLDQSNEFFLCAHNTRSDRLRSTAVKASDVRDMIDESAAQTTLIFLDCCHSGRFKGGDVPAMLQGQGRFVVTSSRSGELANDAHALNHASLFTHHVVEGLRGKAVDHDHDGVVNLSELYDYVHDALGSEGKQVPQKRFEGSGEIPIALRPAEIEDPAPDGLVAPAAATPVLDVSDSVIDLGEVGADEVLPPERIVVINRGGGTLDWTVQASADWVDPIPGPTGVELRLHPEVGPNRANIYITDTRTGMLKTVRIRVRVRPADAPAPSGEVPVTPPPVDETPPVRPDEPPPSPAPRREPAGSRPAANWRGWVWFATQALAILAAAWLVMTTTSLLSEMENHDSNKTLFVRGEWGAGMAESTLLAAALAVTAVIALVRRRYRPMAAGALATIALSAALIRTTEAAQFETDASWTDAWSAFAGPVPLCLVVAALAVLLILAGGRVFHAPVIPSGRGLGALVLAIIWAVSLGQDLYEHSDGFLFGDHTEERFAGRTWQLVTLAILVALVALAVTWLTDALARGVIVGVATVALATVAAEIVFTAAEWDLDLFTPWRLPILLVPALALVVSATITAFVSPKVPPSATSVTQTGVRTG